MAYKRNLGRHPSNRPEPPDPRRWDMPTLIIGLVVIIVLAFVIVSPPGGSRPEFQHIEATPSWPPPP